MAFSFPRCLLTHLELFLEIMIEIEYTNIRLIKHYLQLYWKTAVRLKNFEHYLIYTVILFHSSVYRCKYRLIFLCFVLKNCYSIFVDFAIFVWVLATLFSSRSFDSDWNLFVTYISTPLTLLDFLTFSIN